MAFLACSGVLSLLIGRRRAFKPLRAAPTRVMPACASWFEAWPTWKMFYTPWAEMVHTSSIALASGAGKLRRALLDFMFDMTNNEKRNNLPPPIMKLFSDGKVLDVRCACLGENPEKEYFFNCVEKNGNQRLTKFYHSSLPKELLEYCSDEDGKWDKGEHLRVVLGPNKSFFAWDRTSVRWSNLPAGLESTIQSWLSPAGWVQGPPRTIALGKDGAYFAMSEYGAWSCNAPTSRPYLKEQVNHLAEGNLIEDVEVSSKISASHPMVL